MYELIGAVERLLERGIVIEPVIGHIEHRESANGPVISREEIATGAMRIRLADDNHPAVEQARESIAGEKGLTW